MWVLIDTVNGSCGRKGEGFSFLWKFTSRASAMEHLRKQNANLEHAPLVEPFEYVVADSTAKSKNTIWMFEYDLKQPYCFWFWTRREAVAYRRWRCESGKMLQIGKLFKFIRVHI